MSETQANDEASKPRSVVRVVTSMRTTEGGGFVVRRPFPTETLDHFDPFLLLDEMGPAEHAPGQAQGAPDHPHRGFETVTYLLSGSMQHRDSAGNAGVLGQGDVQWMTAGSGVIHSEMPTEEFQRTGGRMHGFQLWVNLPSRDKMMKPRYQDVPSARIPVATSADGLVRVKVIAGEALGARAVIDTRTPIAYLHFTLAPGASVVQPMPASYAAFAYLVSGSVTVGKGSPEKPATLKEGELAVLGVDGGAASLSVEAGASTPAEVLLIGGEPLQEPIARYGPFVMNTRAEIIQAVEDFRSGKFGEIPPADDERKDN
jgi:redox-sensitive bicupin YhaK (pirin superfamily)